MMGGMEEVAAVVRHAKATLIPKGGSQEYVCDLRVRLWTEGGWDADVTAGPFIPCPPDGDITVRFPDGGTGDAHFRVAHSVGSTWTGSLAGVGQPPIE